MQQQEKPTVVRGYVIQTWRAGDQFFQHQDTKAYAPKGQLPEEWDQAKQDETIVEAKIFSTSQAVKRADKRIIADQFKRSQED